jgi:hypothetical protein
MLQEALWLCSLGISAQSILQRTETSKAALSSMSTINLNHRTMVL